MSVIDTIHPGEVLKEEFMDPLGLTSYRLAKDLMLDSSTVIRIVNGQSRISMHIALRLSHYFGTSETYWSNLQSRYDIEASKDDLKETLDQIVPYAIKHGSSSVQPTSTTS